MIDFKAYQHIDCNGCRANVHSEPEQNNQIFVNTNCGEKHTLGGCYGVIMYPIKNPSEACHESFSKSVFFNSRKNTG